MSEQQQTAPAEAVAILESAKLDKFLPAFRKAQAIIESAEKTRTNEHFGNSYATLASVVTACKKALNDNGMSIIQRNVKPSVPGNVAVETRIVHDSEQFVACRAECEAGRTGPQAFGSVTTYLRRYTLSILAGVCPDDDDAEGGEARETDTPAAGRRQQQAPSNRGNNNSNEL
jgi:hypothetical protein